MHQGLDAALEALFFFEGKLLGGDNNDRDGGGAGVVLEGIEDGEAIHLGHHEVEDDQVERLTLGELDGLEAIGGFEDGEIARWGRLSLEDTADKAAGIGCVIDDGNASKAIGGDAGEGGVEAFFGGLEQGLGRNIDIAGPIITKDGFFDGHGMTRAVDDHQVRGLNRAEADQLDQASESDGGSRLDRNAFHLGDDVDGAEGFFVGNAVEDATGGSGGGGGGGGGDAIGLDASGAGNGQRREGGVEHALAEEGVSATRIAGGEGGDEGARVADRVCLRQALHPGMNHGGTAGRLDMSHGGLAIGEAQAVELSKAFLDAMRAKTTADSLDVPIRGAPGRGVRAHACDPGACHAPLRGAEALGELLGDLEGDSFHGLNGGDGARAALQVEAALTGELGGDLLDLVVGGGDFDDLGAVNGDLSHFFGWDEAGEEGPELDASASGAGRVGDGDVAGGGKNSFGDAGIFEGGDGEGSLAIFEGGGGTVALVFDIDVRAAEHHAQVGGVDEGGAPLAHGEKGIGAGNGEKLAVAPEVEGTAEEGSREERSEMVEIVAGFAPLTTAAGAGNGGDGEGGQVATVKAFEENRVGQGEEGMLCFMLCCMVMGLSFCRAGYRGYQVARIL